MPDDMRNVSISTQLQQCASSNVAGLVGALLAFCLYCYSLSALPNAMCPMIPTPSDYHYYRSSYFACPLEILEVSCLALWSLAFTVLTGENIAEGISMMWCHPAGLHLEHHHAAVALQQWGHLPPWIPVPVGHQNIESNMNHVCGSTSQEMYWHNLLDSYMMEGWQGWQGALSVRESVCSSLCFSEY